MTEPKTVHAWLPSNRSLCDRRARLPSIADNATAAERAFRHEEQQSAPLCGSCMVLLNALRGELAMADAAGRSVWPATASEAVGNLAGTAWESTIDLPAISGYVGNWGWRILFEAIDPVSVQRAVDKEKADPAATDSPPT